MSSHSKISILFITVRADWGGGPEHLWRLLQQLPDDFIPFVACPDDEPYYQRYIEIVGFENIYKIPHRAFSFLRLLDLRRWFLKKKINIIHSHGKGAGVWGRILSFLTGRPCVHTPHGVHIDKMSPLLRRVYLLYEYFVSLLSATVISVSPGEQRQIVSLKFAPERKVKLIPNGVVIPEFPIDLPQTPPFSVVHISRFDDAKNSEALIAILKQLSSLGRLADFHFEVIGDGEGRKSIETQVQELGFSAYVTFYGFIPEPQAYFNKALCLFSTSRWEGMPLAVLEAMSYGLVPIATDVVGNRDAVKDGQTGLLYPFDDAVGACKRLIELADNSKLRESLAKSARQEVSLRYNLTGCVDATCEIYRGVLLKL